MKKQFNNFFSKEHIDNLKNHHFLNKKQKNYLKGHGISERQFKAMPALDRAEWIDECRETAYEKSWKRSDFVGEIRFGNLININPEMQNIWVIKNYLIKKILKRNSKIEKTNLDTKTPSELKQILKENFIVKRLFNKIFYFIKQESNDLILSKRFGIYY